jgi:hypothetical protein
LAPPGIRCPTLVTLESVSCVHYETSLLNRRVVEAFEQFVLDSICLRAERSDHSDRPGETLVLEQFLRAGHDCVTFGYAESAT